MLYKAFTVFPKRSLAGCPDATAACSSQWRRTVRDVGASETRPRYQESAGGKYQQQANGYNKLNCDALERSRHSTASSTVWFNAADALIGDPPHCRNISPRDAHDYAVA